MRNIACFPALFASAVLLVSCQGKTGTQAPVARDGAVTIAGSTALLPLAKQASVDYQSLHPNAKISVSGGGSRVGITQAAQRGVDIGDSDIPAPGEPELVDHRVAVVPFAIIVNPAAGIRNLTKAQIAGIFSGKVTNFAALGGKDATVVILNRPRSSGTRAVFVETFLHGQQPAEGGGTQDSSGTVALMVAQIPGAISYVAKNYVRDGSIVAVSIDGVAPSDSNVIRKTYPFWSYEHMFTNGKPSRAASAFINFVSTDRAALAALGFIPIGDMRAASRPHGHS